MCKFLYVCSILQFEIWGVSFGKGNVTSGILGAGIKIRKDIIKVLASDGWNLRSVEGSRFIL